jgi:hypothetical protein
LKPDQEEVAANSQDIEDELWQPEIDDSQLEVTLETHEDEQLEINCEGELPDTGEVDDASSHDVPAPVDPDSTEQVSCINLCNFITGTCSK